MIIKAIRTTGLSIALAATLLVAAGSTSAFAQGWRGHDRDHAGWRDDHRDHHDRRDYRDWRNDRRFDRRDYRHDDHHDRFRRDHDYRRDHRW